MLRHILLLFLITNSFFLLAASGPTPPSKFFRADTRGPDQIFGAPGAAGFVTWAEARGVDPNTDILDYLRGQSVTPAPEGSRNAAYISVSGGLAQVQVYLNDELQRRHRGIIPEELMVQWVYEIAPTGQPLPVNWMLQGVAQDPEASLDVADVFSLLGFQDEEEWLAPNGIPAENIIRAIRYVYHNNPETGLGEYRRDYSEGGEVINPNFIQPTPPQRLEQNPLLGVDVPTEAFVYQPPGTEGAEDLIEFDDIRFGCSGAGASAFGSRNKRDKKTLPPPAPGCDYSAMAAKKIDIKELPTIYSRLVTDYYGHPYCLSPTNAYTSSKYATRSYLYAKYCNSEEYQKAIYDTYGRIVFPKDYFGVQVCLTAPENVIAGTDSWDWVKLWPCDIKNPYQRWVIIDGKMRPKLNKSFAIQMDKYYGIISKSSGDDIRLNPDKMTKNFFKAPSKPTTNWYEVGMSFVSGSRYYPSPGHIYANQNYDSRTYYDVDHNRLIMLSFYTRAFQSSGWQLRCLTSYLVGSSVWNWNWANWESCPTYPTHVSDSRKWKLIDKQSPNPVTDILIKDWENYNLYANLGGGINWARLFDATYKHSSSTEFFDVRRMYGVCVNPDQTWHNCTDPKHTTSENGG